MRADGACQRCDGEDGVFLIVWVLLLTGLLVMVAIVIDLGALRSDRRVDRAAADAAATAGANDLDLGAPVACTTAWEYAVRNLGFAPGLYPSPCTGFPTCAPANPLTHSVTDTAGPPASAYTITISHPVVAGDAILDGADAVGGDIPQAEDPAADGLPCDRMGVQIRYTRKSTFSKIAGIKENTTTVHSVALRVVNSSQGSIIPSLAVLDPSGCNALDADTGTIQADAGSAASPGIIRVDSTGLGAGCTASGPAMQVQGSGVIRACGLGQAGTGCTGRIGHFAATTKAYESGDFANYSGTLTKEANPLTREPIDLVYHCSNVPVTGCPIEPATGLARPDHIDDLRATYQTTMPGAYTEITACNNAPQTYPPGVYLVSCSPFTVANGTINFQGGTVVFAGGISVEPNGILKVHTTGTSAATVYLRAGGITTTGNSEIEMRRTFVQSSGGADFSGGPEITWTAPQTGVFKDLLYWSEAPATSPHSFGGSPVLAMDGIWFQGNSLLGVQDGSLNATNVQFWTGRFKTHNSAVAKLQANPDRAIAAEGASARLIR